MTNYKNPAPVHFKFGKANTVSDNSPCGIAGLWQRGVSGTFDPARVSCRHCRRWLAKHPEVKVVS